MTKTTAEAAKKAELKERYLAYLAAETWQDDEKMMDYERKHISQVVELDNGELVAIEKPKIETRFCFGYSHYDDSEERAEKMADGVELPKVCFCGTIIRNVKGFDGIEWIWLERLEAFNNSYIPKKTTIYAKRTVTGE